MPRMQGTLRPREVLVSDGPLCTAVSAAEAAKASATGNTAGREGATGIHGVDGAMPRRSRGAAAAAPAAIGQQEAAAAGAELLCCDGCTLAVSGAAQPLLLSGSTCNPPLRPLGGVLSFGIQRPGYRPLCMISRSNALKHWELQASVRRTAAGLQVSVKPISGLDLTVTLPPVLTMALWLTVIVVCSGCLARGAQRSSGGLRHRCGIQRGGPAAAGQRRRVRPAVPVAAPGAQHFALQPWCSLC